MKYVMLLSSLLVLASCGSDSGKSVSNGVRSQIFSDSAVTSFQQTGGVALNKPSLIDAVLPTAYAVSGNISCVEGAPVAFQLDALGNTIQVNTTCNSRVDLSIRQGLLASLASKRMLIYHAGGGDVRSQARVLTFGSAGSFWGSYGNIEAGSSPNCKDKYTFSETNGTVTIEHDAAASTTAGAVTQTCLNAEFVGATAADYKKVIPFRFIDGKLQFDGTGTGNFVDGNDLVKACISSSGTICD